MHYRLFIVLTVLTLVFPLLATGQGMGNSPLMQDARTLVHNHTAIVREVKEIEKGVITKTTTSDPELLPVVRRHPRAMANHLKQGGSVRHWDPLFVELARQSHKVKMTFRDMEGGLKVTSVSEDPEVAKLIKAHAKKVSEFVKGGPQAAHTTTPIPETYKAPEQEPDKVVTNTSPGQRGGCCAAKGGQQGRGRGGCGAKGQQGGCRGKSQATNQGYGRGGACRQQING